MQVEKFIIGGRGIDFEIAGVNDDAERRVDGERDAVHQAVRHLDGMNGERSSLEALVGTHFAQVGVVQQAVLVKFVFDIGERELGAPHGNFEFGEHPGKRTDVVFMTVRQDDSAHALAVFDEIGDVGDHDVDTEKFGFGEHESGVDDDNVVSPTDGHAVHTELAQAPEGDNLQFSSWHGVKMMLAQRRTGERRSRRTSTWERVHVKGGDVEERRCGRPPMWKSGDVEERRFSAASDVAGTMGFSPGGWLSRPIEPTTAAKAVSNFVDERGPEGPLFHGCTENGFLTLRAVRLSSWLSSANRGSGGESRTRW